MSKSSFTSINSKYRPTPVFLRGMIYQPKQNFKHKGNPSKLPYSLHQFVSSILMTPVSCKASSFFFCQWRSDWSRQGGDSERVKLINRSHNSTGFQQISRDVFAACWQERFFGANDGDMCCISRFQLRYSGEIMPPCPSWAQVAGKWFLLARLGAGFLTIRVRTTKKKKQFSEQHNVLNDLNEALYIAQYIWLYLYLLYLCQCDSMCVSVNVCNQYPSVSIVGVWWGYARNYWNKKTTQSTGAPGILGPLNVAIFASTRIWLMPMEIWRMEEAVLEKIQDYQ